MRTTSSALALLLALGALVGCGDDGTADREPVGTLLAGWSEAFDDRDAVYRFQGPPRLVREPAELRSLVELASPELDTTEIESVDLDEVVLVVGSYPQCDEYSSVEVADDGAAVHFTVTKPDPENPIECAWSPMQVDVWEVPRASLADDVSLGGEDG